MQDQKGKTRCLILSRNHPVDLNISPSTKRQMLTTSSFGAVCLNRPTGNDHTLVTLSIRHLPGGLANVLNLLKQRNVNLLELSSHISREDNGIVQFLITFEGHAEEDPVRSALPGLSDFCTEGGGQLNVLGSFARPTE